MSALEAGDTGELRTDLKRKGSRDELLDHRSAGKNWGQACVQNQQLTGGRRMNAAPQTKELKRKPKATEIGSSPPCCSGILTSSDWSSLPDSWGSQRQPITRSYPPSQAGKRKRQRRQRQGQFSLNYGTSSFLPSAFPVLASGGTTATSQATHGAKTSDHGMGCASVKECGGSPHSGQCSRYAKVGQTWHNEPLPLTP